ncbi:MAG TPA: cytochrome b N-terminal domain-containing protein, partial [Polyangiaceae bacterium]|nr:cytochrome b N-terminal domain-containing protein [Polyangiaceae bacterium]
MTPSSSEPEAPGPPAASRQPSWFDERLGIPALRQLLHNVAVPNHGSILYAFGGALVVLLAFEAVTGLLLLAYYHPTPQSAVASISTIQNVVAYGWLLRGLHHWGAQAIVLIAAFHASISLFQGSFRPPREVTWWTGILLGLVVVALLTTGTILPWDTNAAYAARVGKTILQSIPWLGEMGTSLVYDDSAKGATTTHRFFLLHTFVLPCLLLLASSVHVFLVHIHGLAPPRRPSRSIGWLEFFPRAALLWLLTINVILIVAALCPAPFAAEPEPALPPRPAWCLMAFFYLAQHLRASTWLIVPTASIALLITIPWLDKLSARHRISWL